MMFDFGPFLRILAVLGLIGLAILVAIGFASGRLTA